MKRLLFVLLASVIVVLQSCVKPEQTTADKLQGHWHLGAPYFMTLDIFNSVVEVNRYSFRRNPDYSQIFPLYESIGGPIALPSVCNCGEGPIPEVKSFTVNSDSLIYKVEPDCCHGNNKLIFLKCNPEDCKWSHSINVEYLNVKFTSFPHQSSAIIDLDSLHRESLVSFLDIGPPLSPEQFGNETKIQAFDVYITTNQIPSFIQSNMQRYGMNKPVVVCMNIDGAIPDSFIQKVIQGMPQDSVAAIYRLVTSDGEVKLGYQKIH